MGRKKVDLTYIVDDAKRRVTLRQRKSSLVKKVDDISILCGIDACAIIYFPDEPQPEVWPSPSEVTRVISKFRELPEAEQKRKMMTQETFLAERIQKIREKLNRQSYENRKQEMINLMSQCLGTGEASNNLSLIDLNDLSCVIDQHLNEINRIKSNQCQEGTASGAVAIDEEIAQVEAMQK